MTEPAPNSGPGDRADQLLQAADAVMQRARTVAAQSDQLIAALDDAARRLIDSGRGIQLPPMQAPVRLVAEPPPPEPPQPPAQRSEQPVAPAPEPPPEPSEPPPSEPPPEPEGEPVEDVPQVSDGARLLITQMAVSGSRHEEIARRLQEEFGIEDAEETLRAMGI